MKTLNTILETKFREAFNQINIPSAIPVLLVDATKDEFGDYQVNGIMAAAKALKMNPRELAGQIINVILQYDSEKVIAKLEVAGPGFINITLSDKYLAHYVESLSNNNKYGAILADNEKQTVVIDYSSPNLAKEMHVGHLRSTVIGDALANIFEYLGHRVIRQNHVGDWGTQFGMLIAYMTESADITEFEHSISDLEEFYRKAKIRFDEDDKFKTKARQCVVILQNWQDYGEEGKLVYKYWITFTNASLQHCQKIYKTLGIGLTVNDVAPESMYNSKLNGVIEKLNSKNLIQDSNGAKCVFFAEGELSGGESTPFIVQKQDGGFLYSTTDLAAVDYRTHILNGNRLLYVVDARQSFHFKQLFNVAKKAGFANSDTVLEHVGFGTMMNKDGRPFKTRDGGTVKLSTLIHEAIDRANILIDTRESDRGINKTQLAKRLAIASIKYADLSKNRTSDYIFNFDKMLAFDGNTAPYLLYAYTRICSLLKKADTDFGYMADNTKEYKIIINYTIEHKLVLALAKFADSLVSTAKECYPHYLCQYLYSLSGIFMQFYEHCPILKESNKELVYSRLILVKSVAGILETGLKLLGINTVDVM